MINDDATNFMNFD